MDFFHDTLAIALTFSAGLAAGIVAGAFFQDARLEARDLARAEQEPETKDEIFTGRFGRLWRKG